MICYIALSLYMDKLSPGHAIIIFIALAFDDQLSFMKY